METESKYLLLEFLLYICVFQGHTASVGYLAFLIVATTAFVFGIHWRFKSSPFSDGQLTDVGFGQTTWTYYLPLYFAPWNRYQPYLVSPIPIYPKHKFFQQRLEFFLDTFFTTHVARLSRWIQLSTWCYGRWTNWTKSQSPPLDLLPYCLCCGLWSAQLEVWWKDYTFYGNCLQCFSGEQFFITKVTLFQRLAWGFSLAWVIFSCTKVAIESSIWLRYAVICQGYGGPVNDFLSWSVFAPLSRLTYCCYLIHIEVLSMFSFSVLIYPNDVSFTVQIWSSQVHYPQISLLNVVMYFIGGLIISLLASVVAVLAFEIPFTRVEKILVG